MWCPATRIFRLFFYDEQERLLTNVLVKCLARIPAGGKTNIDGYVDPSVRNLTFVPAKDPAEEKNREERLAELKKKGIELKNKCQELRVQSNQRAMRLTDMEKRRDYPEMFDLTEYRRLQGELVNLEIQLIHVAILVKQSEVLKGDVSPVRPREWLRQGIYNGNLIGTNKCRLEFEVQHCEVVE